MTVLFALLCVGILVVFLRPDRLVCAALAGVIIGTIGAWVRELVSIAAADLFLRFEPISPAETWRSIANGCAWLRR